MTPSARRPMRSGMMYRSSRSPWLRRMPTGKPRSTTVPWTGLWSRIRPAGSRGVWTWVSLPLVKPAAWRRVSASSRVLPARSGTVTVPLPELVKTWTTLVTRIFEPAAGSWRTMRPFSKRSFDSVPFWARVRSFFWSSVRAWATALPVRSGTVTISLLSRTWEKMTALRKNRMRKRSEEQGRVIEEFLRHMP